ncbi:MAG: hypothetical protein K2I07_05165 [Lachnospiraceae bacterium]|nr:hypothetical protein [Lachnospiraceae bacterium]
MPKGKCRWLYRYVISSFQCKVLRKILPFETFRNRRIGYYKRLIGTFTEPEAVNEQLKAWILEGKPFAVTRNGMGETAMFASLEKDALWNGQSCYKHAMAASFDKDRELLMKYREILREMYRESDVICAWYTVKMEEYVISKYISNALLTKTHLVDIYDYENCWIRALKGKKVLIVSPFADTILSQYPKRELLHRDKDTLPEFTLFTVKSVWWYSAGRDPRFQSWFEVLDYLYEECMAVDFDIALLSCSTFSSPLAIRLKQAGKQAVHMGGMLQLLFGIKGKRWDDMQIYNEHWVSLPEETKVGNVNVIDQTPGGAYW